MNFSYCHIALLPVFSYFFANVLHILHDQSHILHFILHILHIHCHFAYFCYIICIVCNNQIKLPGSTGSFALLNILDIGVACVGHIRAAQLSHIMDVSPSTGRSILGALPPRCPRAKPSILQCDRCKHTPACAPTRAHGSWRLN